jgi:hypothetical protein
LKKIKHRISLFKAASIILLLLNSTILVLLFLRDIPYI